MNSTVTQPESQGAAATGTRSNSSEFVDLLVFIIPCLLFVKVKAIGVLSGSDILLLAIFIYLVLRRKIRIGNPDGKRFVVLCLLWLGSQVITDIVRHSAFVDYARGWSNVGMTVVNFVVIYTLVYGRAGRLVLYGWGYAVGAVIFYFVNPDETNASSSWKFGFGGSVTLAVFLLISRKECRGYWPVTLSTLIGIINLVMGFRSLGGICLAAALYLSAAQVLRKRNASSTKLGTRSVVMIAASIVLSMAGVLWIYQYAAGTGMLGEEAMGKYENQSSGQYGVLLGGRVEALGYIPAIFDSPILGHGSWARDPTYVLAEHQALALMGYTSAEDFSTNDIEEGYIPSHSCLFGAWVDAGVLGALFWGWVFVLTARALLRIYPAKFFMLPLMCFAAFTLLWDNLFSPYGAGARITMPYYVVLMMTCLAMAQPKVAKVQPVSTKRSISIVSS